MVSSMCSLQQDNRHKNLLEHGYKHAWLSFISHEEPAEVWKNGTKSVAPFCSNYFLYAHNVGLQTLKHLQFLFCSNLQTVVSIVLCNC